MAGVSPDFSRRGFVALTGTALFLGNLRLAFGASDFWNKKDPDSWTGDDIRILTTRSPWAKGVVVISRSESRESYPGSSPAGSGLPGDPQQADSRSIPLANSAPQGGGGRRGAPAQSIVTVRWESAQPIRDALKNSIPEAFDQHYVIAVSGVRIPGADRTAMLELLNASASLEAKGKDRVQPGITRYSKDGSAVLFGFLKEFLPLTAADRDVQFAINTGDLSIRAKFDPKEMIYGGKLAI